MKRVFLPLTDFDGVTAYVNADHIRYIRPEKVDGKEGCCVIYFAEGQKTLRVQEKSIEIVKRIYQDGD